MRKSKTIKMWDILYSKRALKDFKKIKKSLLYPKFKKIINIIKINPYSKATEFEKLKGLENTYSRKLNSQHRVVYRIIDNKLIIEMISCWEHY